MATALFRGPGRCAQCHTPPTYTDVLGHGRNDGPVLHEPSETGMDPVYASRSATGLYRTTPLRALVTHARTSTTEARPTSVPSWITTCGCWGCRCLRARRVISSSS